MYNIYIYIYIQPYIYIYIDAYINYITLHYITLHHYIHTCKPPPTTVGAAGPRGAGQPDRHPEPRAGPSEPQQCICMYIYIYTHVYICSI